jgi:hypothetical protein
MRSSLSFSAFSASMIVTASLVLACSSGSGSGGSGGSAAIDTFIGQFCDLVGSCCPKEQKTYDQQRCRATFVVTTVAGTTYDSVKADTCLSRMRAEQTKPDFCKAGLPGGTKALCLDVIAGAATGTSAPGAACKTTSDCAASTEGNVHCTTVSSDTKTTTTCELEVQGKEGDDCDGTLDEGLANTLSSGKTGTRVVVCDLERGIYCANTKKCAPLQAAGGPCEGSTIYGCVKGAYCDSKTKACIAQKPAGAACVGSIFECAAGHFCDGTTMTCTPQVEVGAACKQEVDCRYGSCLTGVCSTEGGFTSNVCQ